MSNVVDFSPNAGTRKSGRFDIDHKRVVSCREEDGMAVERIGYGSDKDGPALVWLNGRSQVGIPTYAVSTAIASGKVIPFDALVAALVATGQLDNMKKAIAKLG